MLSILIPIYNFDVREFVGELSQQASKLSIPVEILCVDDASEPHFAKVNVELGTLKHVRYERSEVNLGRSKVRNTLAEMASYEHLLYLDCDGRCVTDDYLARYVEEIGAYDVIYGGRVYSEEAPDDHDLYFHWYVGSNREALLVEDRVKNPYKSFMTNNFLIRRDVYDAIKMDPSVEGYGHEDTLFAQELRRAGYHIKHIDNPIEHIGLEPIEEFLIKSKNGVRNLARLVQSGKIDGRIKLVYYYQFLRRTALIAIVTFLALSLEDRIKRNLKGPAPNLLWFDIWKLAYLRKAMMAA